MDLAILAATAAVCVFIFSMSTRLGYSRSDDHQPPIIIRAQVLNACGRANLAARTSEYLSTLKVGRMRFDVIDIGNFNRTDIRRSFIINHGVSDRQARAIADALNIGPVDIIESQTGLGELGMDLTLVLGSETEEPWLAASPTSGDSPPKED
ncbi:MAG: LytR C-terminal domain-containing protein [Candidatus Zixiibacteriota bacterium]